MVIAPGRFYGVRKRSEENSHSPRLIVRIRYFLTHPHQCLTFRLETSQVNSSDFSRQILKQRNSVDFSQE